MSLRRFIFDEDGFVCAHGQAFFEDGDSRGRPRRKNRMDREPQKARAYSSHLDPLRTFLQQDLRGLLDR